ncbi:hypothetical protein BC833DRAFT_589932 [Globomyces pollinis-pini]|nr:hypothetical protein BC833DRAFT_589932 [Globomyces pollinis-pini]
MNLVMITINHHFQILFDKKEGKKQYQNNDEKIHKRFDREDRGGRRYHDDRREKDEKNYDEAMSSKWTHDLFDQDDDQPVRTNTKKNRNHKKDIGVKDKRRDRERNERPGHERAVSDRTSNSNYLQRDMKNINESVKAIDINKPEVVAEEPPKVRRIISQFAKDQLMTSLRKDVKTNPIINRVNNNPSNDPKPITVVRNDVSRNENVRAEPVLQTQTKEVTESQNSSTISITRQKSQNFNENPKSYPSKSNYNNSVASHTNERTSKKQEYVHSETKSRSQHETHQSSHSQSHHNRTDKITIEKKPKPKKSRETLKPRVVSTPPNVVVHAWEQESSAAVIPHAWEQETTTPVIAHAWESEHTGTAQFIAINDGSEFALANIESDRKKTVKSYDANRQSSSENGKKYQNNRTHKHKKPTKSTAIINDNTTMIKVQPMMTPSGHMVMRTDSGQLIPATPDMFKYQTWLEQNNGTPVDRYAANAYYPDGAVYPESATVYPENGGGTGPSGAWD